MRFAEHLLFAALLMPTAAVVVAAALSLTAPRAEVTVASVAEYADLEYQP
jgi:hypothetical protein